MTKRLIGMEIQESSPKCSFVIFIENNSFIVNNQSSVKKIQSIVMVNLHDKLYPYKELKIVRHKIFV